MRIIVTIPDEKARYTMRANCGMNYRRVIGPYKRPSTLIAKARAFAGEQYARIEWYADSILADPYRVTFLNHRNVPIPKD